MKSNTKGLLETFLEQSQEERVRRAAQVDLPDPDEWQDEEQFLVALISHSHDHQTSEQVKNSWQQLWDLVTPRAYQWSVVMLATIVLGVSITSFQMSAFTSREQSQLPPRTLPPQRQNALYPKGQSNKNLLPPIVLQVGLWQESATKIRHIPSNQQVSPAQSLVFGVKITKESGYLYLFHKSSRKLLQIYPMPGQQPSFRVPEQAVQLLQQKESPQRYTLWNERGLQQFILLFSKRPLHKHERIRWQRSYTQQARWDIRPSLKQAGLLSVVHHWDIFNLYVKASAGQQ